MDKPPQANGRGPTGDPCDTRVRQPLPVLSDSERAFWRHAVDQERRQIDMRAAPTARQPDA